MYTTCESTWLMFWSHVACLSITVHQIIINIIHPVWNITSTMKNTQAEDQWQMPHAWDSQPDKTGVPNVNFRKISVRKTIWDLEFSEHFKKWYNCPYNIARKFALSNSIARACFIFLLSTLMRSINYSQILSLLSASITQQ